jgi:hypothetical protein
MAKGANDVILRDRLQFDIDANGDTALVYGRVDMSDYVSIVENKGLAIKEIRFQLRAPSSPNGIFPLDMIWNVNGTELEASIKLFATTTAYELVADVGIASPNVICVFERQQERMTNQFGPGEATNNTSDIFFGTPDLHPEGYDIVTDLLIGIACDNVTGPGAGVAVVTCEVDVMIIAEPKKITQKDLTQMLTQAQDL